jgi:hypothetical protein
MGTGAGLIDFYIVGTQNLAMMLSHIGFGGQLHPNSPCFLLIDIRTVGIGIPRRCYLVKNGPDSIEVGLSCLADNH